MKIENLKEGMIVKNYPEMCELLDQKVTGGKSKKLQVEDWERYFAYHKQGQKFIIDKVYDIPKPKIKASRKGIGSVYSNIIQSLIIHMLLKNKKHSFSISKSKFIEDLGITNRNYYECKQKLNELSNFLEIDIMYIYDFYNINDSNFKSMVQRALQALEDKRIIRVSNIIKIKIENENCARQATIEENEIILEFEKDNLELYGYDCVGDIRKSRLWSTYKKKNKNDAYEKLGAQYYYEAYNLTINEKYLESEKDKLKDSILSSDELKSKKVELNELVCDKIKTNSQKRVDGLEDSELNSKTLIRSFDYVEKTELLSNKLVNIKAPYIIPYLQKQKKTQFKELFDSQLPF